MYGTEVFFSKIKSITLVHYLSKIQISARSVQKLKKVVYSKAPLYIPYIRIRCFRKDKPVIATVPFLNITDGITL